MRVQLLPGLTTPLQHLYTSTSPADPQPHLVFTVPHPTELEKGANNSNYDDQ